MIVYEVNLSINHSIYDEYRKWLKNHIDKMLTFQGFCKCRLYKVSSNDSNLTKLSIHYYIDSLEDLEYYFTNHAEEIRLDGFKLFGDNFSASRRVLSILE